jgi:hypothetical protein
VSGGWVSRTACPPAVDFQRAGPSPPASLQERTVMAETGLPKDLFEFMQKMWNPMSFPIPGMLTPTADVNEIQNKIRELKSVENWLTMNVGFVQMTIKTLEMQKAALESLGAGGDKGKT